MTKKCLKLGDTLLIFLFVQQTIVIDIQDGKDIFLTVCERCGHKDRHHHHHHDPIPSYSPVMKHGTTYYFILVLVDAVRRLYRFWQQTIDEPKTTTTDNYYSGKKQTKRSFNHRSGTDQGQDKDFVSGHLALEIQTSTGTSTWKCFSLVCHPSRERERETMIKRR